MLRLLLICFFFDKAILRTQVHSSALASILSLYVLKAVTVQNSSGATRVNYRSHLKVVLGPTVWSLRSVKVLLLFLYNLKGQYKKGTFPVLLFWYALPVLIWIQRYLYLKNGGEALSSPGDSYTLIVLVFCFDFHCTGVVTGEQVRGLVWIYL